MISQKQLKVFTGKSYVVKTKKYPILKIQKKTDTLEIK